MISLRMTAEVKDDRRVVRTLPPEGPTGRAELVVTVESPDGSGSYPRGVPAESVRGIGAGSGEPPDDATVERWLEEGRMEKYR
jgi:hypothetical protein